MIASAAAQNYQPHLSVLLESDNHASSGFTSSSSSTSAEPSSSSRNKKQRSSAIHSAINFATFEAMRQKQVTTILSSANIESPSTSSTYGKLFDQIALNPSDDKTFHLGLEALIELGHALMQRLVKPPHRGGQELLTIHDQLIIYLMWLSISCSQSQLAKTLGLLQSTLSRTLDKIRPALNDVLMQRFSHPPRPVVDPLSPFPHVALLVDATTVEIPTPALSFSEKKSYYDGHHHCYSMKIEVAVSPHPPHFALFVSNVVYGAIHDVMLFRSGLERYKQYLLKTPDERIGIPQDSDNDSFAIMADKGYIGQFPGLRIITPSRATPSTRSNLLYPTDHIHFPPSSQLSIPPDLYSSPPPSQLPPTPSLSSPIQTTTTHSSTSSAPIIGSPTSTSPTRTSTTTTTTSSSASSSQLPDVLSSQNSPYTSSTPSSTQSTSTQLHSSLSSSPTQTIASTPLYPPMHPPVASTPDDEITIRNKSIAQFRIPVEWFFGRMKRLWLRLASKYHGERDKLPQDLQNACWLTNLSIAYKQLTALDGIFENQVEVSHRTSTTAREQLARINNEAKLKRSAVRKSATIQYTLPTQNDPDDDNSDQDFS